MVQTSELIARHFHCASNLIFMGLGYLQFPDKARREFLEPGKWRVRLLPIQVRRADGVLLADMFMFTTCMIQNLPMSMSLVSLSSFYWGTQHASHSDSNLDCLSPDSSLEGSEQL